MLNLFDSTPISDVKGLSWLSRDCTLFQLGAIGGGWNVRIRWHSQREK
jgi:hypothetical protein